MSIVKLLFALMLASACCFAAINVSVQWDVRTTGNDLNGGGFDPRVAIPGTDYSQQNSPQVAFTDLVIGATNTQLTSAAHPFATCTSGTGYCGNLINITGGSGCTPGWYEVLSTSTITATMDRAVGTSASTCTGNLGGSLLTNNEAWTLQASGNTIWTQSGTYSTTTTLTEPADNSFNWIGYGTVHGDNGTCPLITTATNSNPLFFMSIGFQQIVGFIHNLCFSNTAGTPSTGIFSQNEGSGSSFTVSHSTFTGFTNAMIDAGTMGNLSLIDDSFVNSTSAALNSPAYHVTITHSYFVGNGSSTSMCNTSGSQILMEASLFSSLVINGGTIVAGGPGCGIYMHGTGGYTLQVANATIANNAADGIDLDNLPDLIAGPIAYIESTLIYGNGGWGVDITVAGLNYLTYLTTNGVGANTSGNYRNSSSTGDIAVTVNPFASGSNNYALNTTSGGGAALRGNGYPGTFPGGTTVGHQDIGAVQSACAGGGTLACGFAMQRYPLDILQVRSAK